MGRKKCIVESCKNTTENSKKIFLSSPSNMERLEQWCRAVNLPPKKHYKVYFWCEDHFNLKEDAENWQQYKLSNVRLRLKKTAVPQMYANPTRGSQLSPESKRRKLAILKDGTYIADDKLLQLSNRFSSNSNTCSDNSKAVSNGSNTLMLEESELHRSVACEANVHPYYRSKFTMPKVITTHSRRTLTDIHFDDKPSDTENSFSTTRPIRLKRKLPEMWENIISLQPKYFLGLPKDIYFIVKFVRKKQGLQSLEVLLTLKKIKTGDSYRRLAMDFSIKISKANKIFVETLPILAEALESFIFWPERKKILKYLPKAFQGTYRNVQSIIDCFELEIENYSRVKFLLSATPSGFINYISEAYKSRIPDKKIILNSGYLNVLPKNSWVMVDIGFKDIVSTLMQRKNCRLIRLSLKTTDDFRVSEKCISKIREFEMLSLHACVDQDLIPVLNYVVVISSAIINIQSQT